MTCCRRAERDLVALFQREVQIVDTVKQIVDLARQFLAATDRLTRLRLLLQIVVLAAKAGIDLSSLFAGPAPVALAGPVALTDATEAVDALERAERQFGPEGVVAGAPGTVGGLLPPWGTLVIRVIAELLRLVL